MTIILKLSYIAYSILNIRSLNLVLIKKNQQLHSRCQYWNENETATDHGRFVHKANAVIHSRSTCVKKSIFSLMSRLNAFTNVIVQSRPTLISEVYIPH